MNKQSQTLTVLEAIQLSTNYLTEKGVESPRINSELMLANILNCKRLDLYLSFDRPLSVDEINSLRNFIARRGKFEPLQYILGEVEFFNITLKINRAVLIPRPETELLVEEAIIIITENKIQNILDVGTGSGNIPIALAKNTNGVDITSIDFSQDATNLAIQNAKLNGIENKIIFSTEDINKFIGKEKYDMIVSNPPYVSYEEYSLLQKEILEYEPKESVTDNSDGYKFYKTILSRSTDLLNDGGYILFEIGKGQSDELKDLFVDYNIDHIKTVKDFQNIDRVIIGKKK